MTALCALSGSRNLEFMTYTHELRRCYFSKNIRTQGIGDACRIAKW